MKTTTTTIQYEYRNGKWLPVSKTEVTEESPDPQPKPDLRLQYQWPRVTYNS